MRLDLAPRSLLTPLALAAQVALAAAAASTVPAAAGDPPTFHRDVAPILRRHCVTCHAPGEVAPMSLRTYQESRPWAKTIARNVRERRMPPWHAEPGGLRFANDRSLAPEHVDTLVRWAQAGAIEGDPAGADGALPPPPDSEWRLGEPDLVLELDAVEVPAGGPDRFRLVAADSAGDPGRADERWISAIEVLPGDRSVVHHVLLWVGRPEGGQHSLLGGWAAGTEPLRFPAGTARRLPAGHPLLADVHYHPTGTATTDRTRLGIHFVDPASVEKELTALWILDAEFEIPPGAPRHPSRASHTFLEPVRVHGLTPHLHYRGTDASYTAFYPDGRRQELLRVKWDFNWQTCYWLAEPLDLPAGTRLEIAAHWDNSAANPANPDPTRAVRWGPGSTDEMLIGFVDYVPLEGRSPDALPLILGKLPELIERYPGEVWMVDLPPTPGVAPVPTALRLPRVGSGAWYLQLATTVFPVPIEPLEWNGDSLRARVDFGELESLLGKAPPGAVFELSGELDPATGTLELTLGTPAGIHTIEGVRAEAFELGAPAEASSRAGG